MLRLVDSHAHIYLDAFDNDREEMIDRAKEAGVGVYLETSMVQGF